MRISDLLKDLQEIQDQYGDLPTNVNVIAVDKKYQPNVSIVTVQIGEVS